MLEKRVATGTMTVLMRWILHGGQEPNRDLWLGLMQRLSPYVYAVLRKLGLPKGQLEEGCSEVLCRLVDSINKGNYDSAQGLRKYLSGIARHVRNAMLKSLEKDRLLQVALQANLLNLVKKGVPGPSDQAEMKEEEAVRAEEEALQKLIHGTALDSLRGKAHRNGQEIRYSTFVAHHRLGTSWADIARQYEVKEATVKSWGHRMKKEYGTCLAEAYRVSFGDDAPHEWRKRLPGTPFGDPMTPSPDPEMKNG